MFLKAIALKSLALSVTINFLMIAGERFNVCNMGNLKDMSKYCTDDSQAVFIYLKDHPGEMVSWIQARDSVKSWKTDVNNYDILHLEFNNGENLRLDLTKALQQFVARKNKSSW